MKRLFVLLLLIFTSGCNIANESPSSPTPTPQMCFGFILEDNLTCIETGTSSAVLQSDSDQSVLIHSEYVTITVQGTTGLSQSAEALTISALEGSSIVSMEGRTRVLQAGSRLRLLLVDGVPQRPEAAPERIEAIDLTMIPASSLPRPIAIPVPAEPTATATQSATGTQPPENFEITPSTTIHATSNICEPREDWVKTYTVEAGDVLESIANRYTTTVLEIARANCLLDPGRLRIGQILRVPGDAPTLTPSAIAFRADLTTLARGECTVLRWDVFNVKAIYIEGAETSSSDVLRVCPETTTTYTLRVTYPNDTDIERTVTITVSES